METNYVVSQNDYSCGNAITTIGNWSTASQINPNPKKWAEIVQHISNTHKEFTNDKWDIFFSHLQTVANTDCSSFFAHDKKLSNDIKILQENLKTIIAILDKASVLHEKETSLKALQLELDVEITKVKGIVNKLYEPHGGNKLIYNKRSKESNDSMLFNTTVILSVASILLSVALFALPLVFPVMLVTGATVLTVLCRISALVSCVSGSLAIYERIKKGEYKLTKLQEREFTEALSALHNYLNKLNFPHATDEAVNRPVLLRDNNTSLQDKEAKDRLFPPDIQQLLKIPEIQKLLTIIQ
ncbi:MULTISPECIES: hypothetical protein [Symbiopectobacterium]|uniref:hypothetical protein n=1 Tax=Symbiopectobacterium TaxID=801 RepID=UPI001A28136B|nr:MULTISPECIES: hypothetical protein [Symbiopectobacterium]MBG6247196.1 hypothetical protein [Candidatus Symbiopectobacterium sp. PLON1]MBT9428260.1 hypothetical protein [Candidatus Symbiopectobacterium endolongispinus]